MTLLPDSFISINGIHEGPASKRERAAWKRTGRLHAWQSRKSPSDLNRAILTLKISVHPNMELQ